MSDLTWTKVVNFVVDQYQTTTREDLCADLTALLRMLHNAAQSHQTARQFPEEQARSLRASETIAHRRSRRLAAVLDAPPPEEEEEDDDDAVER